MASVFGCIVPQVTLPLTGFSQLDSTHWILELPISLTSDTQEVLVFLTGAAALPDGYGASIFISLEGTDLWTYLGHLHNNRVSDLFRIPPPEALDAGGRVASQISSSFFAQQNSFSVQGVAQIGIELELLTAIQNREIGQATSAVAGAQYDAQMAQFVAKDVYNYLTSFAQDNPYGSPTVTIPLSALNAWLDKFMYRLQRDRHFWKKQG
eukprot:ANDGO_06535.mRNA.1 Protein OPI10 homolog